MGTGQRNEYLAYRYLLLETAQVRLFVDAPTEKKSLMRGIFKQVRGARLSITLRGRKHLLYLVANPLTDVYVCRLAPERRFKKHTDGGQRLEEVDDVDFPPVGMIVDVARQVVLLERRPSVYPKPGAAKRVIQSMIRRAGALDQLEIAILDIVPSSQFWDVVQESSRIYQLQLVLEAPNLFGGRFVASELVKDLRDLYGSTENRIEFRNPKGNLTVKRDILGSAIDYISSGGGRYRLVAERNGQRETHTSAGLVTSVWLEEGTDGIRVEELENELERLNRLNER